MFDTSLRIVVCDSQRIVCEALSQLIAKQFPSASVDGHLDIAEATRLAGNACADLLVLQIPSCDSGVAKRLIATIKRSCPRVRLLCIVETADPATLFNVAVSSADACLLACEGKGTLFDAICALRSGQRFRSSAVRRTMVDRGHLLAAHVHLQGEVA